MGLIGRIYYGWDASTNQEPHAGVRDTCFLNRSTRERTWSVDYPGYNLFLRHCVPRPEGPGRGQQLQFSSIVPRKFWIARAANFVSHTTRTLRGTTHYRPWAWFWFWFCCCCCCLRLSRPAKFDAARALFASGVIPVFLMHHAHQILSLSGNLQVFGFFGFSHLSWLYLFCGSWLIRFWFV